MCSIQAGERIDQQGSSEDDLNPVKECQETNKHGTIQYGMEQTVQYGNGTTV